jgi:hypothetical protein
LEFDSNCSESESAVSSGEVGEFTKIRIEYKNRCKVFSGGCAKETPIRNGEKAIEYRQRLLKRFNA